MAVCSRESECDDGAARLCRDDLCGGGGVARSPCGGLLGRHQSLIQRYTLGDQAVRTSIFDEPVTALTPTDCDEVLVVVLGSSVILTEPAGDVRGDGESSFPPTAFHLQAKAETPKVI